MHVLVAPAPSTVDGRLAGPGHVDGAFCWTVPGELLIPGMPCDSPTCGCDRAFTGLQTRRATTVGVVADLSMTVPEFKVALRDSTERAGWDDEEIHAGFEEFAEWLLGRVAEMPTGTLVRVHHEDGATVLDVE